MEQNEKKCKFSLKKAAMVQCDASKYKNMCERKKAAACVCDVHATQQQQKKYQVYTENKIVLITPGFF